MNKEEITESVKWLKEEYSLLCQIANALPNSRSKRNIQKEAQMLKRIKQLLTRQPVQVDEEALAERLVNLSLSIAEQTGDTQRFLKAKRFIEDNLTHSSTSGNDMSDGRRGGK